MNSSQENCKLFFFCCHTVSSSEMCILCDETPAQLWLCHSAIFTCPLCREQITLGCRVEVVRPPKTSRCSQRTSKSSRRRRKTRSSSSRSRSRSSGSSRYSGRYSRSLSLSSCRWPDYFYVVPLWHPLITQVTVSAFLLTCIKLLLIYSKMNHNNFPLQHHHQVKTNNSTNSNTMPIDQN